MRLLDDGLYILRKTRNCGLRIKLYAYSFSFLFSLSMIVGKALYDTNDVNVFLFPPEHFFVQIFLLVLLTLILGNTILFVFNWLGKWNTHTKRAVQSEKYKKYVRVPVCSLLFFLSWLPAYLAYYPGILSYDMGWQTSKALGDLTDISRYQPPLHTLFWKGCLYSGKVTGIEPIIIYSIIQMFLLAWACSRMVCFMLRRDFSRWMIIGSTLFLALNPVIAICSFVPAKDMCFAVCFLLHSIEWCEFLSDKKAYVSSVYKVIRFIVIATLCCLLRNNAVYAMVLLLPFVFLLLKEYRIRWTAVFGAAILIFWVINGPFFDYLGIREGRPAEMLSVPMQQIAYVVYSGEELTEEEIEEIDTFIPYGNIIDTYNPRFADPIKGIFDSDEYEDDKGRFIRLWWKLFQKYPRDYINAFLTLNLPYWYQGASAVDAYAQREYIETHIGDAEYTFERASKIPWLYEQYEKVASYEMFENIPIISHIFSLSTVVWVLMAGIWILMLKRNREAVLVFLPSLLLWVTFMAGPVSNFRYIFPIYIQYPLFVAVALFFEIGGATKLCKKI